MPYTLVKFFLWGLLMALAGGVIGWLLRSLKCRAEVARARTTTVDDVELDRLRGRLANLEPVVAERDRLRMELADVRGSSAGALGFAAIEQPAEVDDDMAEEVGEQQSIVPDAAVADEVADVVADADADADAAEAMPAALADVSPAAAKAVPPVESADAADHIETPAAAPEPEPSIDRTPDVSVASKVLGKKIRLDDLTVVEGIGPKISELCNGIGVSTWAQLAATDVDTLQSMLNDAGSRFQMHKPASWPRQADLLATGRWAEFQQLTDELSGGT